MPEVDTAAAARVLASGELVAFPTETVYGLGADASSAQAVAKIFALKGRPADHPLIVHIHDRAHLSRFAAEIPAAAEQLATHFWPGPLTLILRRARGVPPEVTGGQDTVGVRVPSHPIARALLEEFNRLKGAPGGVAAPSANRFGHVSPTAARHVRDEFGDALPVIDGGDCPVGIESTIVDLSRGRPVLLRPGSIGRRALEAVLAARLEERDAAAPRASGTLAAHYAPRAPLSLVDAQALASAAGEAAVLAFEPRPAAGARAWIVAPREPDAYGHDLYANLRALDASGARRILVEAPPRGPAWEAVNDRLDRAAAGAEALGDEP